jgi:hypothetical protein
MPALNIRFTDDELAQLRERASNKGVSMLQLAHDAVVNCGAQSDRDARWGAATARVIELSQDLLARLADQ